MTPTAAWPWCSGSGAARTQMPPEPVCKCPRVSRRTANTCSLLWGTPRSPAPGNTSPDPGGQSGRWETAISSWLDCHKGQGTGFFWAQWFAIFLWLSAVSEGCQGLPWEGAASPGLWLATEWWQEGQGWTGLAQRPETQTGRRRQPGDLCWCCRARTPQTQNGSCEHTHTHTHTHTQWTCEDISLPVLDPTLIFHLIEAGCFHHRQFYFTRETKSTSSVLFRDSEMCCQRHHHPLFIDFQLLPSENLNLNTKCAMSRLKVIFTPSVINHRTIVVTQPTCFTHSSLDGFFIFYFHV